MTLYIKVSATEFINPLHVVSFKFIKDELPPQKDITAIEFILVNIPAPVKIKVSGLKYATDLLNDSGIVF